MGIRVQSGVESVTVQINYRDRRRRDKFTVLSPNIDYSVQRDTQPIYSMFGEGAPVEYVGGPARIELTIRGVAQSKRSKKAAPKRKAPANW